MASGTRSGRSQKDEDTATTDSVRVRFDSRDSKDIKYSTTSGSAATDSSTLRRSTRETPGKNMRESSPITRKSERLEKRTASPSVKRKLEGVEKKRPPSPLRRSERIEKIGGPSSSGSKKSKKSSSSLDKEKREEENNTDEKVDINDGKLMKKKKRLDARSYRALFKQNGKKAKKSGACQMPKDEGNSSEEDIVSLRGNSKEVPEGGDECSARMGDEMRGQLSDEDGKEAVEGSSSGSRELDELTLRNDGQRRSPHFSGNHTLCVGEANESKYDDSWQVPRYNDSSLQLSPGGIIAKENGDADIERETDAEADGIEACCLASEELRTSELEFTSEGMSLAADIDPESGGEVSKRAKMTADLDSDFSVTPINNTICILETSTADAPSSSPFGTREEVIERCTVCSKLQRAHSGSPAQGLCSCNAKTRKNDLTDSFSEEVCEPVAVLASARKDKITANCCKEDKAIGDSVLEAGEQSVGYQKRNCNSLTASTSTTCASVPMEEDRGRLEARDKIGSAEEGLNAAHLKESSLAILPDNGHNACVICKHPGLLLCCDGKDCKRSYHLSCLDPPLKDVPPGLWHCLCCVRKKIESGVYSVSEGMESVWDAKDGMQNEKHYLVKYRGLAHVHSRWIPESQMLLEAPMLVAEFNRRHQKEKVIRWKKEWTEPQRLLQKRLLMPIKLAEEYFGGHGDNFSYCYYEWLVKWKGLGYEYATWEFENSPFLRSSEAMVLIKDYESRREEANKASDPSRANKALQVKENPFHKLLKLPEECPSGLDNDHLNSVNKLREFWHKAQNAVFIDNQERIVKSILFILSLQSHTLRPFLIVSTTSLSFWETEFIRLAPSINVVVYNGNKDVRKMIRRLEFFEGGCVMFQVLLSHPDAIIEDFEAVDCIAWEAIIVDECQHSRVSKSFEQFSNFTSDFRLLLLSGPLKDNLYEYLNMLSFLDSGGKDNSVNSLKSDSNDTVGTLAILKERLARYLAYERKPDSSKFLEYWVPVQLSNVQLEQYCATLIANSSSLSSCSKVDHVGALRDILISTRKCCDHPFQVDECLQTSLFKGLPVVDYLDVGVNASGKLQLLDRILQEIKIQGLRVLILFQSIGGAGRNSIGDILDDFLRQRFGGDSYERVDSGLIMSRKQAALNKFNDKARGRFAFLIENRACLPSIKLSSVDAVIIYDSDWNPLNDLRALQKISIDSQYEQVKVFRLYSSCTIEEKILIFAKQDVLLESNIQSISRSVSLSLLSWGASYLFKKLDEFHQHGSPNNPSEISSEKLLLIDVVSELLTQLPSKDDASNTRNCSILIKVQQSGASYSRNIVLVGEREKNHLLDENLPAHLFWSKLLNGRYPQWRYISGPSQRNRRKVQYYDDLATVRETGTDEVKKKRRKLGSSTVDPISLQTLLQDKRKDSPGCKDATVPENPAPSCNFNRPSVNFPRITPVSPSSMYKEPGTHRNQSNVGSQCFPSSTIIMNDAIHDQQMLPMSHDTSEVDKLHKVESEGEKSSRNTQKNLHLLLKPELLQLSETLGLPEDVKRMAEMFLEYIMNNHHVSQESETILQAFKLSLCWRAASFLKHKVDHTESVAIAKKYLNFQCMEEEAEFVYLKLQMLKHKFSRRVVASSNAIEHNSIESRSSAERKVITRGLTLERSSKSSASDHQELEEGEILESSDSHRRCKQPVLVVQEQAPVQQTTPAKLHHHIGSLKDELLNKRIDLINKICSRRTEELLGKQRQEVREFFSHCDKEKLKLKKTHEFDLDLIRSRHIDSAVRNDKIQLLDQEFSKQMDGFDQHIKSQRKKFAVMQINARNKERQIKDHWLEEARAGRLAESFDNLPLSDSGFRMEEFTHVSKQAGADDRSGNTVLQSVPCSEQQSVDMIATRPDESFDKLPLSDSGFRIDEFKHVSEQGGAGDSSGNTVLQSVPGSEQQSVDLIAARPEEFIEPSRTSAEVPATLPNGGADGIPMETQTPGSLSNSVNDVESIEMGRASVENSAIFVNQAEDRLREPDALASQSNNMNAVGNGLNRMDIDSGTTTAVEVERHANADNSDGAFLISSPLQSPTELPSLNHASTSSGCENSLSSNLVPSLSEHERPASSVAAGSDQGFRCPQQIVGPELHSIDVPSQADLSNHNVAISDPFQLQLPPSSGMVLVEQSQSSTPVPRGIRQEPCNQMRCSIEQTGVSMQQSVVTTTVQVEQSNQPMSQTVVHPMVPHANIPPETTRLEGPRSAGVLPLSVSNLPHNLPAAWMPPQGLHLDPLQNELTRIRKQDDLITQKHEDMKLRLKLECEKEIEKVRRKYDASIQDAETVFVQEKKLLEMIYTKVYMNRVLAEEFRAKFFENKGGASAALQGGRSYTAQQFPQLSQPQFVQRPASASAAAPPPSVSSLSPAPAPSLPPLRLHAPASAAASLPSLQMPNHTSAVFSTNPVRPHFSPLLPSRANFRIGSEPRAPAPHLQPFRPHTTMAVPTPIQTGGMTSQQHLQVNPVPASSTPQVSRIPPLYPPWAPVSVTHHPDCSVMLPACNGTSLHTLVDLPPDVGGSCIGANLPHLSIITEFDRWLQSEPTVTVGECGPSGVDFARPTSQVDIVCLSDED